MGARARISDGPNSRHGRFNITRRQHGRLADENGIYLFAVHTGGSDPGLSPYWVLCGLVRDGDGKIETTGEIDGEP
jgi:hypothetical protein